MSMLSKVLNFTTVAAGLLAANASHAADATVECSRSVMFGTVSGDKLVFTGMIYAEADKRASIKSAADCTDFYNHKPLSKDASTALKAAAGEVMISQIQAKTTEGKQVETTRTQVMVDVTPTGLVGRSPVHTSQTITLNR